MVEQSALVKYLAIKIKSPTRHHGVLLNTSNKSRVGQRFAVKSPMIALPVPEEGSREYIDRCIIFMDDSS